MEVLWKNCLDEMEKHLLPENFNTWFTPLYPCAKNEGTITLAVPNHFFEKCLTENYLGLIEETLERVCSRKMEVRFRVKGNPPSGKNSRQPRENGGSAANKIQAPNVLNHEHGLNHKYHFDSFVVGPNNQFAQAAAQAVAQNPAQNYNPLFLYGAVGLGKTHLLHAIGNIIIKENPTLRVRYISAESFTVDLIESIRKDRMMAFR